MKKVVIVSGYFNPLHLGHLRMIQEAKLLGDIVVVIVNNDRQQMLKKDKIIMGQSERILIIQALKGVARAVMSVDEDATVMRTLVKISEMYPDDKLIFANGGDRGKGTIPEDVVCELLGIDMVFGVGGQKLNSSSEINQKLGHET